MSSRCARFGAVLLAMLSVSNQVARVCADDGTATTHLKSDERLTFFPAAGWLDLKSQTWTLPIHGWIYEPESDSRARKVLVGQVESILGRRVEGADGEVLRRRMGWFLVDNERGKEVLIRIAGRTIKLEKSSADGHFAMQLRLPAAAVQSHVTGRQLAYEAVLRTGDQRRFAGVVRLVHPTGRTIISDIDDTVKITEVGDKRRVLENTLARPFRPVDGMSQVYRRWAELDAEFVWVSSSPWQLYEELDTFFTAERFPAAVWQLKQFRIADGGLANLLADPERSKVGTISRIIERHPSRKYVLIGDSGERDPEAYGRVAAKFPEQVERIFIRDVTDERIDSPRYIECWKNLRAGVGHVFRDPATLRLPDESNR